MPQDINSPAMIIFLKENYEKEKLLRAQWVKKHQSKMDQAVTLQREPTNYYEKDVIRATMAGGMATITRDHVVAGYNRRKQPIRDARSISGIKDLKQDNSIVAIGLGDVKEDPRLVRPDTDLSIDPVMRPVNPKLTKIFYTIGREPYLKKRFEVWPEKKYYFPECSNWVYGWRKCDSEKVPKSQYARCWRLKRSLHSRVGPQPDPEHYKIPTTSDSAKCKPI